MKQISSQSKCIDEAINANSKSFELLATLRKLNVLPQERAYLNFYRFDNIDEMSIFDVSADFRFIWYPQSDDIDIFDSTLTWILSVSHDGELSLVRFDNQQYERVSPP